MRASYLARGSGAVGLSLMLAVLASGCAREEGAVGDVCERATRLFTECGLTLPILSDGTCTGVTRAVARCVANHASNCDELASLRGRIDACVADEIDGGDALIPAAEDLPLPVVDGGHEGAADASADGMREASSPDATGHDAGLDGGNESGATTTALDATGTVLVGEEARFATAVLPAGAYTFAMTGTGDADLYVRIGSPPTTHIYDCRPFLLGSNESCVVTLAVADVVDVMVYGAAPSSTFTLTGRP